MKRTDKILLVLFLVSIPLCIFSWLFDIRLMLVLPFLPLFCLQLLICRRTGKRLLRLIPFGLVLLWAGFGGLILLLASGWDELLGLIMLFSSIAPAAGCAAAAGFHWLFCRPLTGKRIAVAFGTLTAALLGLFLLLWWLNVM